MRIPAAFPRVRATFVAPMFPDPTFRRSSPRSNAFATSTPNGIDPSRYAKSTRSNPRIHVAPMAGILTESPRGQNVYVPPGGLLHCRR